MDILHTFKLPTGIECSVTMLTGMHQRILTQQGKKSHLDSLDELIVSLVKKLGSLTSIDLKFVKTMLACDKKMILVQARQFTMSDEDDATSSDFQFTWEYQDATGNMTTYQHIEVLPDGRFPYATVKVLGEEKELIDATYTEYEDVERFVYLTLKKSKQDIRFIHLDGKAERRGAATKKSDRSSHTLLKMRNPCYKAENGTWVQLNLDKLPYKDIEQLRRAIKDYEGQVHTEIRFDHPESEMKSQAEKLVTVDVLATTAFFFPSEAL